MLIIAYFVVRIESIKYLMFAKERCLLCVYDDAISRPKICKNENAFYITLINNQRFN